MRDKILALASKYQPEICQFLIDIVNIPSTSGNEERVAKRIIEEMKTNLFDEARIDKMGNVIGKIGTGPRIIAFDAHIDTVDVGNPDLWETDPYDAKIGDGYISGRGTSDQKGGMAAMVYAGRIIKELGLEKDFTFYFTGTVMEEDCDGLCWRYIIEVEKIRPEFVVITEPTNMGIYRGQRGRMEMRVSVPGRSAHGSAPERGDNAIYKMTKIVHDIEKFNNFLPADNFLGKGSIAVTQISSNAPSLCAIPDHCAIHIDRRLTWGETKESAVSEIKDLMSNVNALIELPEYREKSYTGLVYPAEKYYPTWKIEEEHPVFQSALSNFTELFSEGPRSGRWTFSTNGIAICGIHGIPCVGFGPGLEELAHAPNERTPVDHLIKACAFYSALPLHL